MKKCKTIQSQFISKSRLDGYNNLKEYKENILSLKEKYFNRINVLLGLECDYFEDCFDYNQEIIDFIIKYLYYMYNF